MRTLLAVACVAASAATSIFACTTFDESSEVPGTPDADTAIDGSNDSAAAGDGATDATAPCTPEPEWAYTGGTAPTVATCDGVTGINLLMSSAHCGRCGHSCGSGACVDGLCAAHLEHGASSPVLQRIHQGTIFYTRRPPSSGHEIWRIDPGGSPKMLGALDTDAGDDRDVLDLDVDAVNVYLRTKTTLRRTKRDEASGAVPEFVAKLATYEIFAGVTAGAGVIYVSANGASRFDAVSTAGSPMPFLESSMAPLESKLVGNRFVWLSQPYRYGAGGNSVLHLHDGTTDRILLETPDHLGGLVIDGNEAILMRGSAGGAILAVDLDTANARSLYDGSLDNAGYQFSVAIDATHVYWVRSLDGFGIGAEIWKRARCGGAAVRIAKHSYVNGIGVTGGQVWFGAEDGLWSFAK